MANNHEVELKLELGSDAASLKDHPFLSDKASQSKPQNTIYFDTAKGALRKAGFSLRVRSSGGKFVQTVKQIRGNVAGMFDRPEWECEIDGPGIDFGAIEATPLAAMLEAKLRRDLEPVIVSDVVRTIWVISHEKSQIELNLDEGTIRGGSREQKLRELELELRTGDAAALMDVARELGRTMKLKLGVMTKAERGFALADDNIGKVRKAEAIEILPVMSVAESFVAIAHSCLKHFRLNEALVAERREAAALHQARVAMRRLRSAFSLFGPATRDADSDRIREELRWFTDQLGDARNLDVLLTRFDADTAPRRRLLAAREKAYDVVLEALNSQRFHMLMLDLLGWLEFGQWRGNSAADTAIGEFARKRINRRWRKVKKAGRNLVALEEGPRHRVRIDIKKLRYSIEFLASLYGSQRHALKAFVAGLEEMQEELGYLNDIVTARILLSTLAGGAEELIPGPEPKEEVKHLAAAQRGYAKLIEIEPFWH